MDSWVGGIRSVELASARRSSMMCTDGGHGPFEDILSEGGSKLGEICRSCRKVLPRCRVCRKIFKRLDTHFAMTECGMFDKAGLWWTADRPPTAKRFERGMNP